jgi:hypothetical protein
LQDFYAVVTSPARDIYHFSLDIFHLPFKSDSPAPIAPDDRRQGLKMTKWQISNDKWKMIWLWVDLNHQRAYETLVLIPLELHSR